MPAAANSTALLLTIRPTKAALPYLSVAPATTDAPPCPRSARPSDRLGLPNAPLVRPREASQLAGESRRVARTSRAAQQLPSAGPFDLSGRDFRRRSAGVPSPPGPPGRTRPRPPDSLLPRRAPSALPSQTRQSTSSSARYRTRKGCVPRGSNDAARGVPGAPRRAGARRAPAPSRSRTQRRAASTAGTDGPPRPAAVVHGRDGPARRPAAVEAAHPDGPPGTRGLPLRCGASSSASRPLAAPSAYPRPLSCAVALSVQCPQ